MKRNKYLDILALHSRGFLKCMNYDEAAAVADGLNVSRTNSHRTVTACAKALGAFAKENDYSIEDILTAMYETSPHEALIAIVDATDTLLSQSDMSLPKPPMEIAADDLPNVEWNGQMYFDDNNNIRYKMTEDEVRRTAFRVRILQNKIDRLCHPANIYGTSAERNSTCDEQEKALQELEKFGIKESDILAIALTKADINEIISKYFTK